MKIRTDFVTNSSSSSYIIAFKQLTEIDVETVVKYPFLKNYSKIIEKILLTGGDNDTTEGEIAHTLDEYNELFKNQYCFGDWDTIEKVLKGEYYLTNEYNTCSEYLSKGFNILLKSVDYNDEYCSKMIEQLAEDKDNFVLIKGD